MLGSGRRVSERHARSLRIAALLAGMLCCASAHAQLVVNDTGDAPDVSTLDGTCATAGGVCTLRAAIQQLNASGGGTISFNIAGAGPHTITPATALPPLTQSATIDGYTQPGAASNTNETAPAVGPAQGSNAVLKIVLNGAGLNAPGLQIQAGTSSVRGLVVNGFDADKVVVTGGAGHKIEGNFIGTDVTGMADASVTGRGVQITGSPGCTIGGVLPAQRNVIAGNNVNVYANFTSFTGASGALQIQGNLIGTNAAGTSLLGAGTGIAITGGTNPLIRPPDNHVIGGADGDDGALDGRVQARNLIAGHAIEIHSTNSVGTRISGNFIGTDVTGEVALDDFAGWGVEVDGISADTLLGGWAGSTPVGAPNTICCVGVGVLVAGGSANTDGVQVLSNRIGISAVGQPLGNGIIGVDLNGVDFVQIGGPELADANLVVYTGTSSSNPGFRVSGSLDSAIEGNVIAHNAGRGIHVDTLSRRMQFTKNEIFDNGLIGIDLTSTGQLSTFVTPNDPSDADTGGNGLQNFPRITSATALSGVAGITVIGDLGSTPSGNFDLELFASADSNKDPSGYGEGEEYVDTISVATNASGKAAFAQAVAPATVVAPGTVLTATATDAAGDTSEFSAWVTVAIDDPDGDGVSLGDNCPFESNSNQADLGGIGAGSAPDGIGDACQCGDVNGNGFVTTADATIVTRALLVPPTATMTRPDLCDVGGSSACSTADATIITRALLLPPTATIAQSCPAARP